jgi:transcriptional regulator with XRE-family HTH domain
LKTGPNPGHGNDNDFTPAMLTAPASHFDQHNPRGHNPGAPRFCGISGRNPHHRRSRFDHLRVIEIKRLPPHTNEGLAMAPRTSTRDLEIGKRIRTRRKALRLTQPALAADIGVSFQQLQKYEKGTNRVPAARMPELATALHVPVSYFLTGIMVERLAHDDGSARKATAFLSSDDGVALMTAFLQITTPRFRKMVIDFVTELASVDGAITMHRHRQPEPA